MSIPSNELLSLSEAINILVRNDVCLSITSIDKGPYCYDIDGQIVTEDYIMAYARALTGRYASSARKIPSNDSEKDHFVGASLLGRAMRVLAFHGIMVVITKKGDSWDCEIDGISLREIDVIVRAAMIDISLLSQRHIPLDRPIQIA